MGGNIFSNSTRLNQEQYQRLYQRLNVEGTYEIKSYASKESHGDLDIVVDSNHLLSFGIRHAIKSHDVNFFKMFDLNVVDFFHNQNAGFSSIQVDFEGALFQIDFIFSSLPSFAASYFSFNDLGNLIGRVAHSQGLKFGHEGLIYVLRDGDQLIQEITLTTNFDQALEYLGFDVQRYHQGFVSLVDIFEFVCSSKYFNPEFYDLERRSHIARTRDRKRKTYQEFLKYINTREFKERERLSKEHYLPKHWREFPKFKQEYDDCLHKHHITKQVRKHLNSDIIADLTGLQGKKLGMFIAKVGYKDFVNKVIDAMLEGESKLCDK